MNFGNAAAILSGGLLALAALPAAASTTFFSNLGTSPDVYVLDGGLAANSGSTTAVGFTSAASGPISEIELGLTGNTDTDAGNVTVTLFDASSDFSSLGAQIGQWTLPETPLPQNGTTSSILQTVSVTGVSLTSGDNYYVQVVPSGSTQIFWNNNWGQNAGPMLQYGSNLGTIGEEYAPGALAVVGGLSGTPEPTTWALLLVGFASLGAAARTVRRRRPVAA